MNKLKYLPKIMTIKHNDLIPNGYKILTNLKKTNEIVIISQKMEGVYVNIKDDSSSREQ